MDLGKQFLEPQFKRLVLAALIELANKMSTRLERLIRKGKGGGAKVLKGPTSVRSTGEKGGEIYHAASVISKAAPARIHQPAIFIRVTDCPDAEAARLGPGC